MMKQFVKTVDKVDKESDSIQYPFKKFTRLPEAKIKEVIFDQPQIRSLSMDKKFDATINTTELESWLMFKNVVNNFLGNHKYPDYTIAVANLLDKYKINDIFYLNKDKFRII